MVIFLLMSLIGSVFIAATAVLCCFPAIITFIASLFDKGNRFDGKLINDLPSTFGFLLSFSTVIFLLIYLPIKL